MLTKCIIFDADGVIINSEAFSLQYQKEHDVSNDDMLPFFKGDLQDCIIGKADLTEAIKPWLSKWKWTGTVDELLQFWFKAEHNINENIVSIIQRLKKIGIKCYLATNQEKHRTQYMKDKMGFESLFNHVFSSSEIGYKKPEKGFYKFILDNLKNKYQIDPDEIMFFDDSQKNISGAIKLNINAHLYKNFEEFKTLIEPLLNKEILN